MLDAITTSQIALLKDQLLLQGVTQNISNMNTPGYKREILIHGGFDEHLVPNQEQVTRSMQSKHIHEQGTLNQTNRQLDIAISGSGYFEVQNDQGIFYTRRGDFHINERGELSTASGALVLGRNGPIHLDEGNFSCDRSGNIYIDHQKTDQLRVVTFHKASSLDYVGQSLYKSPESAQTLANKSQVLQGFVEQANVKSVDEMMEMLKISRHFEANQRVMRMADTMMAAAINQLGDGNV